jgi:cytoskeleton protein RodZ
VGSFGERLRREREMRGIGLDEIATATKISARNLRALEDEKFSQLPGGIFNKGFVRAYAKFLGIDQDQIVAEYEAASQETEVAREQKLKEDFSKAEFRKLKKEDNQEISLEPKSQWGTIAIIVLIAAIGYGGYSYYQRRKLDKLQQAQPPAPVAVQPAPQLPPPTQTSPTPLAAGSANAAATPNAVAPNTATPPANTNATAAPLKPADTTKPDSTKQTAPPDANRKTEVPGGSTTPKPGTEQKPTTSEQKPSTTVGPHFELKIKVNKQSWVSIKADGKTLINGTLQPGTERTVKATDRIDVILGNAGGVEVSYNGKPVENLNTGQDVRKLTFTPSGYE